MMYSSKKPFRGFFLPPARDEPFATQPRILRGFFCVLQPDKMCYSKIMPH